MEIDALYDSTGREIPPRLLPTTYVLSEINRLLYSDESWFRRWADEPYRKDVDRAVHQMVRLMVIQAEADVGGWDKYKKPPASGL